MPVSKHRRRKRVPQAGPTRGQTPDSLSALTWGQIEGDMIVLAGPEGKTHIADSRQRFVAKFGRQPEADDPVLFDPDADTPQFIPAVKIKAEMIQAMSKAGIEPVLIYCYAKTGLIISNKNRHIMSKQQIRAWNAAVAEYEQMTDQHVH